MWCHIPCSRLRLPQTCHNKVCSFLEGLQYIVRTVMTVSKRRSSVPWKIEHLPCSLHHHFKIYLILAWQLQCITGTWSLYRVIHLIIYFDIMKYTPHICCYYKAWCIVCVVDFDMFTNHFIHNFYKFPFVQVSCFW